jgi:hypothetical protein
VVGVVPFSKLGLECGESFWSGRCRSILTLGVGSGGRRGKGRVMLRFLLDHAPNILVKIFYRQSMVGTGNIV